MDHKQLDTDRAYQRMLDRWDAGFDSRVVEGETVFTLIGYAGHWHVHDAQGFSVSRGGHVNAKLGTVGAHLADTHRIVRAAYCEKLDQDRDTVVYRSALYAPTQQENDDASLPSRARAMALLSEHLEAARLREIEDPAWRDYPSNGKEHRTVSVDALRSFLWHVHDGGTLTQCSFCARGRSHSTGEQCEACGGVGFTLTEQFVEPTPDATSGVAETARSYD